MSWLEFRPGERDQIVAAVEGAKQMYVQVRNGTNDTPVEFVVAVADLPKPPKGVDDDVEIVLRGDRCPSRPANGARRVVGNPVPRSLWRPTQFDGMLRA
jgi:hypothetical protein